MRIQLAVLRMYCNEWILSLTFEMDRRKSEERKKEKKKKKKKTFFLYLWLVYVCLDT